MIFESYDHFEEGVAIISTRNGGELGEKVLNNRESRSVFVSALDYKVFLRVCSLDSQTQISYLKWPRDFKRVSFSLKVLKM